MATVEARPDPAHVSHIATASAWWTASIHSSMAPTWVGRSGRSLAAGRGSSKGRQHCPPVPLAAACAISRTLVRLWAAGLPDALRRRSCQRSAPRPGQHGGGRMAPMECGQHPLEPIQGRRRDRRRTSASNDSGQPTVVACSSSLSLVAQRDRTKQKSSVTRTACCQNWSVSRRSAARSRRRCHPNQPHHLLASLVGGRLGVVGGR